MNATGRGGGGIGMPASAVVVSRQKCFLEWLLILEAGRTILGSIVLQ